MDTMNHSFTNRQRWAWAFYDWANSAFATAVMVALFPIFFRKYWAAGLPSETITLKLGSANAIASVHHYVAGTFFWGTLADQAGIKKPLLAGFVALGVCATLGLTLVGEGQYEWAMFGFVLAMLGFLGGNIFYDSLLVDVAEPKDLDRTSSLGYSLGYLGGGLLFVVCVLMTLHPEWFGAGWQKTAAVRWSFGITAVWWALFSIPLWLWVRERTPAKLAEQTGRRSLGALLKQSVHELLATLGQVRRLKGVGLFLLAYWFYIDGVDTIIVMAIDYGKALGFADDSLITALLLDPSLVAFPQRRWCLAGSVIALGPSVGFCWHWRGMC